MSSLGVHFAITKDEMRRLLRASRRGDDDVVLEVIMEIEEAWDHKHLIETDKGWDAIHRCLTGDNTPRGRLNPRKGSYPLKLCIIGGKQLYRGSDYTIALVRPDQVPKVASALVTVDEAWLRERFFALDERACGYPISEDVFSYVCSCFRGVPELFARAGKEGRAVVFTVGH
jgi:hypothetical protein